jgi:thymidine phosphorylase
MSVIFSDMDQPLGRAIGHANETVEAFDALRPGHRQTAPADLVELTEELAADMVRVAGIRPDQAAALALVREVWDSGAAFQTMLAWVAAQGGRLDPEQENFGLEIAPVALEVTSPRSGWLAGMDCREVGLSLADLGGARRKVEDPLDLTAGILFHPAIGDRLEKGSALATIQCKDASKANTAATRLISALTLTDHEAGPHPLILDRIP